MAQTDAVTVWVDNGAALAATTELGGGTNLSGNIWTLVAAVYRQLTAITSDTDDYYTLAIHKVTAEGTHTTAMATATLQTTALTAYVPLTLTLDGTAANLALAHGQSFNCLATKVSSAPNLDASGRWTLVFAQS